MWRLVGPDQGPEGRGFGDEAPTLGARIVDRGGRTGSL
jgi:hypothetical protein